MDPSRPNRCTLGHDPRLLDSTLLEAVACTNGPGGEDSSPTPAASSSPSPTATPLQQTVMVNVVGPGLVVSDPAGVDCPGTCAADFDQDTDVTLQAAAVTGAAFQLWFDTSCDTATCVVNTSTDVSVETLFYCNPLDSGGCTGEGCRLGTYRGEITAQCSAVGAGTQGATCAVDSDCAANFFCVDLGGSNECRPYCAVGTSNCAVGTCTSFGTAQIIDGVEYGVCL